MASAKASTAPAASKDADLIVVGSSHRGPVGRVLGVDVVLGLEDPTPDKLEEERVPAAPRTISTASAVAPIAARRPVASTNCMPPPRRVDVRRRASGSIAQISVVLADDHNVIRANLRNLLEGEEDLRVIGEAADASTTAKLVKRPAVGRPCSRSADAGRGPSSAREPLGTSSSRPWPSWRRTRWIRSTSARELLRLLAVGHTNREIGERLFLSVRAIEVNRAKLLEKLGIQSRPDLMRFAIANGII